MVVPIDSKITILIHGNLYAMGPWESYFPN